MIGVAPTIQKAPSERILGWNQRVLAVFPDADAISIHPYIRLDTRLAQRDPAAALEQIARVWRDMLETHLSTLPAGTTLWVTEYNAVPFNRDPAAGTWMHGLAALHLTLLIMQDERVEMLLLHQLTGHPQFASMTVAAGDVAPRQVPLTGVGHAMRLLGEAAAGSRRATAVTHGQAAGWQFDNGRMLLINGTAEPVRVNLPGTEARVFRSEQPLSGQVHRGDRAGRINEQRQPGKNLELPPRSAALVARD